MSATSTTATHPTLSTMPSPPPRPPPSSETTYLSTLQEQGYVHIPSLLPPHLLLALQATSKYTTQRARNGQWPHVRTVPKQYPPWPPFTPGTNIWGVQHLLHPSQPMRSVFAELYFDEALLSVVRELVGARSSDELVMELFNLLVSPSEKRDFELCWHRDDVRPELGPAEEAAALADRCPGGRQLHAQYNVALCADDSLVVVPGSHRRARTGAERAAAPFERDMPGQLVVRMEPGDAVFYDSNILHRGVYRGIDAEKELGRMTLHGSVGLAGFGNERARQVLQHSVGEWVGEAEFQIEGEKGRRAEAMRRKLMDMGKGDGLGYSLEG